MRQYSGDRRRQDSRGITRRARIGKDGRKVHFFVEHTIASTENLMTSHTKLENVDALVAMTKSD